MRSTTDAPPRSLGRGATAPGVHTHHRHNDHSAAAAATTPNINNNNNGNSGSQYALCALGVGLIALGIVMIVWSVVPADAAGNSSISGGTSVDDGKTGNRKNKASSVAFVLVGSGVVMLLLSLCVGMRNKQREQRLLREARNSNNGGAAGMEREDQETPEEEAQRYAVPSYEEAVGSGPYPVGQSSRCPSASQLPSYDDLVEVDGVQYEHEGPGGAPPPGPPPPAQDPVAPPAAASAPPNRRPAKTSRKLLPLKIRRIKSEKTPVADAAGAQPALSIEPLTPPPQYDDKVPPPL